MLGGILRHNPHRNIARCASPTGSGRMAGSMLFQVRPTAPTQLLREGARFDKPGCFRLTKAAVELGLIPSHPQPLTSVMMDGEEGDRSHRF